ncbi:DUF4215 domain-containing protein [Myxococcus fulvus]|uniref:DUF4215 domain-containing protein n=1 Tax=Myxococcus fulvus TaxID=33 RepID=UPI0020BE0A79
MFPNASPSSIPSIVVTCLAVLTTAACIESKSVTCKNGLVCPAGMVCAAEEDRCIQGLCGDATTQKDEGEQCDDGNSVAGDGCSPDCMFERCGNGLVDLHEECDYNADGGVGCNQYCAQRRCGDGLLDPGEACDDGNEASGDGCNATCTSTESCGNRFLDPGELCDDGNRANGDKCSSDCRSMEACGNGIRDIDEECDDGNESNSDDCLTTCVSARCGDGFTNSQGADHEACDDGPLLDGPCRSDCRSLKKCGNALVDPGEECDDGNDIDTDACPRTCKNATCGDGFVLDTNELREECDDGNTSACGSCSATCTHQQEPAHARGVILIDLVDGGVQDGEILIVSDGVGRCIFEFDTDGEVLDTHAQVRPSAPGSGMDVADHLFSALGDATTHETQQGCDTPDAGSFAPPPALRLNVRRPDGGTRLELEHRHPGPQGNQPIIESVVNPGFTVTSLGGGTGMDCPAGTGCTDDRDCDPVDGRHECLKDDDQPVGRCGVRRSP